MLELGSRIGVFIREIEVLTVKISALSLTPLILKVGILCNVIYFLVYYFIARSSPTGKGINIKNVGT